MEPEYHSGDLLVAYRQPSYDVGQTIIYNIYGGIVVHNIITKTAGMDGETYISQGINNANADSWVIKQGNVRGLVFLLLPGVGGVITALVDSPLLVGLVATSVAAIVVFPRRRVKLSKPLLELLKHSATETRKISSKVFLGMLWLGMLVLATLFATTLGLMRQLPIWPQVYFSLGALLIASTGFAVAWWYFADGRGLLEPRKSMAILGPRLHRIPPSVPLYGTPTTSAFWLREMKERTGLPVLHQIIENRNDTDHTDAVLHKFFIVTDGDTYEWSVSTVERLQ